MAHLQSQANPQRNHLQVMSFLACSFELVVVEILVEKALWIEPW